MGLLKYQKLKKLTVIEAQINDWMKSLSQILELDYSYLEIVQESDLLNFRNLVFSAIKNIGLDASAPSP